MFQRSISTQVLKSITSAAASAGLASLVVMAAVSPAAASKISACQNKHSQCSERCIMKYSGPGSFEKSQACIKRTCDKQNPGCGGESLGGKSGGSKLSLPPIPTNDRGPIGAGVLDHVGDFSNRGPAATGATKAPPAAVIIR